MKMTSAGPSKHTVPLASVEERKSPAAMPLVVAMLFAFAPAVCHGAVQECQARVLQPVTDDMGHTWAAGDVVPVDIAREHDAQGIVNGGQFCAHGGACLPRQTASGQVALQLTNCKVGPSIGGGDFRLVPDARLAGTAAAAAMDKRTDTENRLSELGFSNAAAGSLADEFVTHPRSPQGQLVGRALAGSAVARRKLQAQFP